MHPFFYPRFNFAILAFLAPSLLLAGTLLSPGHNCREQITAFIDLHHTPEPTTAAIRELRNLLATHAEASDPAAKWAATEAVAYGVDGEHLHTNTKAESLARLSKIALGLPGRGHDKRVPTPYLVNFRGDEARAFIEWMNRDADATVYASEHALEENTVSAVAAEDPPEEILPDPQLPPELEKLLAQLKGEDIPAWRRNYMQYTGLGLKGIGFALGVSAMYSAWTSHGPLGGKLAITGVFVISCVTPTLIEYMTNRSLRKTKQNMRDDLDAKFPEIRGQAIAKERRAEKPDALDADFQFLPYLRQMAAIVGGRASLAPNEYLHLGTNGPDARPDEPWRYDIIFRMDLGQPVVTVFFRP